MILKLNHFLQSPFEWLLYNLLGKSHLPNKLYITLKLFNNQTNIFLFYFF